MSILLTAKQVRNFMGRLNLSANEKGCWLWTGHTHPKTGYAEFTFQLNSEHRKWLVHRFAYFLFRGEIPEGMLVCHTCDIRHCCNPEHLWLGTPLENMRDMRDKGRSKHAPKKLSRDKVRRIRRLKKQGVMNKVLASYFGVSERTISLIVNHKAWADVAG